MPAAPAAHPSAALSAGAHTSPPDVDLGQHELHESSASPAFARAADSASMAHPPTPSQVDPAATVQTASPPVPDSVARQGSALAAPVALQHPAQPTSVLTFSDTSLPLPVAPSSADPFSAGTSVFTVSVPTQTQCVAQPSLMVAAARALPALNPEEAVHLAISEHPIAHTSQCQRVRVSTMHGPIDTFLPPVARAMCALSAIGTISGYNLACYVDTGANVSLITSAAAKAAGLQVMPTSLNVQLATASTASLGGITSADVRINAYVGNTPVPFTFSGPFVIVPALPGGFDVLLSARFFLATPFGVLMEAQQEHGVIVSYAVMPHGCTAVGTPTYAVQSPRDDEVASSVASRFIGRARVIDAQSSPAAESSAASGHLCAGCQRRGARQLCTGCVAVAYCSEQCRSRALPTHRYGCRGAVDAHMCVADRSSPHAGHDWFQQMRTVAASSIGTPAFWQKAQVHFRDPVVAAVAAAIVADSATPADLTVGDARGARMLATAWTARPQRQKPPDQQCAVITGTVGVAVSTAIPPQPQASSVHASQLFPSQPEHELLGPLDELTDELQRGAPTHDDIAKAIHAQVDAHIPSDMAASFVDHALLRADIFGPMTTAAVEDRIKVEVTSHEPIDAGFRPIRTHLREAVIEQLRKMLADGIIAPCSSSRYSSPLVVVGKRDTPDLRLCIDLRAVNAVTKRLVYRVPTVPELLDDTKGFSWFSSIDIKSAFHQLVLDKDSQQYFAFDSPIGRHTFTRMPFGWVNAPAVFQRVITRILSTPFTREFIAQMRAVDGKDPPATDAMSAGWVRVYMDDILVMAGNPASHLLRLLWVFHCLHVGGMRINLKKCRFLVREVSYLGQIIDGDTRRIDPDRIQGLRDLQVPKRLHQLQAVLGLYNYYAQFIPRFAQRTAHMRALSRPNARVASEWNDDHLKEFKDVQGAIINAVRLYVPDFTRPFYMRTDASLDGIGAYLYQLADDGKTHHPVYFWSRRLTPAERKDNTTEREGLAIAEAVDRFSKSYLMPGVRFYVETDHRNLTWMADSVNTKVKRWVANLARFDFVITFVPGVDNTHADALSRVALPPDSTVPDATAEFSSPVQSAGAAAPAATAESSSPVQLAGAASPAVSPSPATSAASPASIATVAIAPTRSARAAQARAAGTPSDSAPARDLIDATPVPVSSPPVDAVTPSLLDVIIDSQQSASADVIARWVRDGAELRDVHGSSRRAYVHDGDYLVPEADAALIHMLLQECHNNMAHPGTTVTLANLRRHHVRWRGMASDVSRHIDGCTTCVIVKAPTTRRRHVGHMGAPPIPSIPFDGVLADYYGPIYVENCKYHYILVIIDAFSRFVDLTPTETADSASTIAGLQQYFTRFGAPRTLQTDGASHFDNAAVRQFLQRRHVAYHVTTPYNPQSNGIVERRMSIISRHLRALLYPHFANWDKAVPNVMYAINTARCDPLGYSPYEVLFGRRPRTMLSAQLPAPEPESDVTIAALFSARDIIRVNSLDSLHKARERDRKTADSKAIFPVYAPGDYVVLPKPKSDNKLDLSVDTPYKVVHRVGELDVYELEPVFKGQPRRAHVRDMFLYPMSPSKGGKYAYTEADEYHKHDLYNILGVVEHEFLKDGTLHLLINFEGTLRWQVFTRELLNRARVSEYLKAHKLRYNPKTQKVTRLEEPTAAAPKRAAARPRASSPTTRPRPKPVAKVRAPQRSARARARS